jgi:linoleoyl-CoA desaturase
LLFFSLAFALPLALHPVTCVLELYALAAATLGLVLGVVFQLAHCTGHAQFRQVTAAASLLPRGWAEHQVESTVDFARGNRLLGWYVGGLNLQIEHHLFPRVCHVHYAALAPIVEDACRRHGVRYTCHRSLLAALAEHVRWLGRLGRSPEASPDGAAELTAIP